MKLITQVEQAFLVCFYMSVMIIELYAISKVK